MTLQGIVYKIYNFREKHDLYFCDNKHAGLTMVPS